MHRDPGRAYNFGLLLNQIRWITRLSVALSSSVRPEDVYSVLLSGLISPLGLGYSSALLFDVDPRRQVIHGKYALGMASREEMEDLRQELEGETEFLERRRTELEEGGLQDSQAAEDYRTLELSAHWVTVFQRLGPENPFTDRLEKFERPLGDLKSPAREAGIFGRALSLLRPTLIRKADVRAEIPPEVGALIEDEFALVPIRTNLGLRGVVLVDRRITQEPITQDDLEALDWFATQGGLALQNAELIADLETAYRELKDVELMKSNFLSIISHELRTPLTAITGFVELVLNGRVGDINETQKNLLGRVAKNTGHLNNMVNDLIEITEIEAEGMREVSLEAVDPLQTLFNTLPKLEYRRRDKHVQVEPVLDVTPPQILCDERALERIYFHLLDNAVKFSHEQEVVQVEFRLDGDDRLAIAIRDHGVGIPDDKLKRIFDQFYQIDNSMTRAYEGLGLGLAVTRLLVKCVKGSIAVESEVGKGSCFTVTFPLWDSSAGIT